MQICIDKRLLKLQQGLLVKLVLIGYRRFSFHIFMVTTIDKRNNREMIEWQMCHEPLIVWNRTHNACRQHCSSILLKISSTYASAPPLFLHTHQTPNFYWLCHFDSLHFYRTSVTVDTLPCHISLFFYYLLSQPFKILAQAK